MARMLPLLLLLAPCQTAAPPSLAWLRSRLVTAMLPDVNDDAQAPAVAAALAAEAPWLLQTQRADGSWPDID